MKPLRFGLVLIITLIIVAGISNMAMASHGHGHSNVSIGLGIGYPGFYGGWGYGWGGHHSRSSIFVGGYWPVYEPYPVYQPYYYPNYYVVDPPPVAVNPAPVVVQRPPVVVERQQTYVQPRDNSRNNQALFQNLRDKKTILLNQLRSSDKNLCISAIKDLAGYSYDDTVRAELENILLNDPDVDIRIAVANAFGSVKNAKLLPVLENARVEDSNADVRRAADAAIKNIYAH